MNLPLPFRPFTFTYSPTVNNDPTITTSVTAPSLEAVVSALCEKVFGAKLHIEAPPALTTDELANWEEACRAKDADIDKLLAENAALKEAAEYRERYIEKEHIAAWRKIQAALPPQTIASGMSLCDYVIQQLYKPRIDDRTILEAQRERDEAVADALAQREEVKRLAVMLDVERTRLAACGVVALADTPESAVEARKMLPQYHSASCGDVERRVDECIKLRQVETLLRNQLAELVSQRNSRDKDLFAYAEFTRNIATALGMGTHEISFKEVLGKIESVKTYNWHPQWRRACETIEKVTAERNDLHAERDRLKASLAETTDAWQKDHMEMKRKLDAAATPPEKTYRDLVPGEIISKHDEYFSYGHSGEWKVTACGGEEYRPSKSKGGEHLPHRRQV